MFEKMNLLILTMLFTGVAFAQDTIKTYLQLSGKLKEIGIEVEGKRRGEWKLYEENGELKTKFLPLKVSVLITKGIPSEAMKLLVTLKSSLV